MKQMEYSFLIFKKNNNISIYICISNTYDMNKIEVPIKSKPEMEILSLGIHSEENSFHDDLCIPHRDEGKPI